MTIRVLISGAHGRMGQETVKAISADSAFTYVGDSNHQDDLGARIQATKPQVVIDFTTPESVYQNTKIIIEHGVHPVIGTTGFTPAQIKEIETLCEHKKLGGIIAPNFSLSAVLMLRLVSDIARFLPDAEIIEYHHTNKKDAPSGTAKKTAENIARARKETSWAAENPTTNPARGDCYEGVPIHSVRLPGLIAHQSVIFGGVAETLVLKQDSFNRECFMPGVIMACKKVVSLNKLVYGLENLLG